MPKNAINRRSYVVLVALRTAARHTHAIAHLFVYYDFRFSFKSDVCQCARISVSTDATAIRSKP